MTGRPLVLGIDVSPLRLGFGLVTLDDGAYVASGHADINLSHHEWRPQRIADAFDAIVHATRGAQVSVVCVELPWIRFPKNAFMAGRAVQAAVGAARRKFREAAVHELQPKEWRKLAGLPGGATKHEVMDAVLALRGRVRSRRIPADAPSQDEANGLMIAVAAQRLSAQTWDRAIERGVTTNPLARRPR